MPTIPCEFERFFPKDQWFWGGAERGKRKKKTRCPMCGKRLHLQTVPDHWPHSGIVGYRVPRHRTTAKRAGKQLRLPHVKMR